MSNGENIIRSVYGNLFEKLLNSWHLYYAHYFSHCTDEWKHLSDTARHTYLVLLTCIDYLLNFYYLRGFFAELANDSDG